MASIRAQSIEMVKINYKSSKEPTKYRYGIFKTYSKAAQKVAWWMLFDKYGYLTNPVISDHTFPKYLGNCTCYKHEYQLGEDEFYYDPCPIHNRIDGYIIVVHDRLAEIILANLEAANV